MSGPSSGALKDGVSLKAVLAVNTQGGGCLSAFAIRAWLRMIIAVEESHLQELNFTSFTFIGCSQAWRFRGQKQIFLPAKKIRTFPPSSYILKSIYGTIYINMLRLIAPFLSECLVDEISLIFFGNLYMSSRVLCIWGHLSLFFMLLLYSFCVISHKIIHPMNSWEMYCCRVVN